MNIKSLSIFLIIIFLHSCESKMSVESIPGCIDIEACNYSSFADEDDGSCEYCIDCIEVSTPLVLFYPSNFPTINIPEFNPLTQEGVSLGRQLFYDPILSSDNTVSCASCHKQEYAFSDDNQFSFGVNQSKGNRHAPTIINPGWQLLFDWDGKSNSLEEQASRPILSDIELHNNNWIEVINRLEMSDLYTDFFCAAFGTETIDSSHVLMALAQFERTLVSSNSRFDKWLNGEIMFTDEELDGFDIYATERGDCFHCHPIGLFTDNLFHNNGLDSDFQDLGRYDITGNPLDQGLFKSPTLRNIEFSAPYMHDGRFKTLEEVINHYNFGGYDSPTVDPLMKYVGVGLLLSDNEKANLKTFLLTLSDEDFINNPNFSNPINE